MKSMIRTLGVLSAACLAAISGEAAAASSSDDQFQKAVGEIHGRIGKTNQEFSLSRNEQKLRTEGASAASWDDIKKRYSVSFPQVQFGNWSVSVDQLCKDGDSLRPFNPNREVCVRWEGGTGERDGLCVEKKTVALSRPITSERPVYQCSGGTGERDANCVQVGTRLESIPLSYQVPVVEPYLGDPNHPGAKVVFKQLDIPACR